MNNQRKVECTVNTSMISFWMNAAEDWDNIAKNFGFRKDWKNRDLYSELADKARAQVFYIQNELAKTGESMVKVGTHGNMMNVSSRTIKTAKGKVQL